MNSDRTRIPDASSLYSRLCAAACGLTGVSILNNRKRDHMTLHQTMLSFADFTNCTEPEVPETFPRVDDVVNEAERFCSSRDSAEKYLHHHGRRRGDVIGSGSPRVEATNRRCPPTFNVALVTFIIVLSTSVCQAGGNHNNNNNNGARSCQIHSCVERLSEYRRFISGGLLTFDIEPACLLFDDMSVCVWRAILACAANNPSHEIRDVWLGLNSSLTYICKSTRNAFTEYSKCYQQPVVSTSIKKCNKTYHMELDHAKSNEDVCRLTKTFMDCLQKKITDHCQSELAAKYAVKAVRLLRQPRMEYLYACTLDCAIIRSSLVVISTAVLLSTRLSAIYRSSASPSCLWWQC